MESDGNNYTSTDIPEGFVEITNEHGEKGFRLKEADDRLKGREQSREREFLMVRVPGLLAALQQNPRMPLSAMALLLLTVQYDRTRRKPLKINRNVVEQTGFNRSTLSRAAAWLAENLEGLFQVTQGSGKASQLTLTAAGRKTYHPPTASGWWEN